MASNYIPPGSDRQLRVFDAINNLHSKLLQRYRGYDISDIMLRAAMESICPLAPREAKDYALRRLRQDFGGAMDRDTFKHVLCNVIATDRSIPSHEVLGRIEGENTRLQKAIDYDERTKQLSQKDASEDPYFLPSRAAERLMTQERTVMNMEESLREMERKYQELSAASDANKSAQVSASRAILDARRRAEEDVKKEMEYEKKPDLLKTTITTTTDNSREGSKEPRGDEPSLKAPEKTPSFSLSATTTPPVRRSPDPVPQVSSYPTSQINVEGVMMEVRLDASSQGAAQAVMMAEARAQMAERKLMEANAKLERYGHYYDRRGETVHNTRMIADAAYAAKRAQMERESEEEAYRDRIMASISTITSPYIRGGASQHMPSQSHSQQQVRQSSSETAHSTSSMGYDAVLGPASFALRSAHRDTDTVLSAPTPIAFEDASRILLPTGGANSYLTQPITQHHSPPPGVGYQSRMSGMYHLLNLEKNETNRWRNGYGSTL